MSQVLPPYMVKERLFGLAVQVKPGQIGLHVHPGSTIPPLRLSTGWHYHWPILSVLRVYQCQPAAYVIGIDQPNQRQFGDQPVVAVTHDHHLFTITAELNLEIDPAINNALLAKLDGKSTQRLVRPLVRQAIRQVLAVLPASSMSDIRSIQRQLSIAMAAIFKDHGLIASQVRLVTISPYHFGQKNLTQAEPGSDFLE